MFLSKFMGRKITEKAAVVNNSAYSSTLAVNNSGSKIVLSSAPVDLMQLNKGIAYACNNMIAKYVASTPLHLYKSNKSGKKDFMWPATQMGDQIMSRLAAKGFTYPYSHIAYDTGHQGFIQKKECWSVISDFLKKNYAPN